MSLLAFNKHPNDSAEFSLDFAAALSKIGAGDETISATSWSLAAGLSEVSKSNDDKVARVVISGGSVGEELAVSCQITTSGGKTITDGFLLAIADEPPQINTGLTTISRLAFEIGVDDNNQQQLLVSLIEEATAIIEEYCGRSFAKATVTEKLPGYGSAYLRISRMPIQSITSIKLNESTLESTSYRIHNEKAGIIHGSFGSTAAINASIGRTPIAGSEQNLYEVEYVGGYILPGNENRDLPRDIEYACIQLAKQMYHGQKANPLVRKESVPNVYTVEYASSDTFMDAGRFGSILDKHKIVDVV